MDSFESRMNPKVPVRIREGDVVRAKSNVKSRGGGGMVEGLKEDEKGKRRTVFRCSV